MSNKKFDKAFNVMYAKNIISYVTKQAFEEPATRYK